MEAPLKRQLSPAVVARQQASSQHAEVAITRYWLIATAIGVIGLWDWISAWNVPATLQRPWLVLYLLGSFALSQILYALVARHDGRPFFPGPAAFFAVGNGIAETLAFALVYRFGEVLGTWLVGLVAPSSAALGGFVVGIALFVVYGGLIHARFWLHVLPPHLDDSPRARAIRRFRPFAEVALVVGWSLCFWLTRDIWLVVFFHILVDIGLMLKVRPPIFGAG